MSTFASDLQATDYLESVVDNGEFETGAIVSGLLAVAEEQRVANMLEILKMSMDVFGDLPAEDYHKRRELLSDYLQEYVKANVG